MKFYVTFGQSHAHSIAGKTFDKDCVAVLNVDSYEEGRRLAFEYFGLDHAYAVGETLWSKENIEYFPRGYIYL